MTTLFARHMKAWLYAVITDPCIFSAGCRGVLSVTYRPRYLPTPSYLLNVSLGRPQGWSGTVAGMRDIFYLQQVIKLRLPGCPASIVVAIPTELSGVSHMSIFLDLMC